jgi:RNA polymerase sigma-B factor
VLELLRRAGTTPDRRERAELRERVISELIPFAHQLARRFRNRGEPLDDLQQVAVLGLIKAVDGFESRAGNSFAAYAVPTVLGELRRHFRDKGWMIRVPRSLQERRADIMATTQALTQELGRTPTTGDLAGALGLQPAEVDQGLDAASAYSATSLERPVGESGLTVGDCLPCEERGLDLVETRLVLRDLLAELPCRQRRILGLRFFNQLTQSEIAAELGISQMHVSRLLRQSLDSLRCELNEAV